MAFDYPKFHELFFNTLWSRNVPSQFKSRPLRKMRFKFLTWFNKPNIEGGGANWITGEVMLRLFYFVKRFGNCSKCSVLEGR